MGTRRAINTVTDLAPYVTTTLHTSWLSAQVAAMAGPAWWDCGGGAPRLLYRVTPAVCRWVVGRLGAIEDEVKKKEASGDEYAGELAERLAAAVGRWLTVDDWAARAFGPEEWADVGTGAGLPDAPDEPTAQDRSLVRAMAAGAWRGGLAVNWTVGRFIPLERPEGFGATVVMPAAVSAAVPVTSTDFPTSRPSPRSAARGRRANRRGAAAGRNLWGQGGAVGNRET